MSFCVVETGEVKLATEAQAMTQTQTQTPTLTQAQTQMWGSWGGPVGRLGWTCGLWGGPVGRLGWTYMCVESLWGGPACVLNAFGVDLNVCFCSTQCALLFCWDD